MDLFFIAVDRLKRNVESRRRVTILEGAAGVMQAFSRTSTRSWRTTAASHLNRDIATVGFSTLGLNRQQLVSKYPFVVLKHTMTISPAVAAARATLASIDLANYDAEQSRLMEERCIVVDEADNALGAADKKTCMCSSYHLHKIL
jgi:hypothetical protein